MRHHERVGFGQEADADIDEVRYGTTGADVAAVPEPTTLSLLLISGGTIAMIVTLRRRRRA